MLDQEGAFVAERLGLDVVVDELAVALAAVHVRVGVTGGGRAAEKTELHRASSCGIEPRSMYRGGARFETAVARLRRLRRPARFARFRNRHNAQHQGRTEMKASYLAAAAVLAVFALPANAEL